MVKLHFRITTPKGQHPKDGFPFFVLEQDNWNDYSFQTLYHLTYYSLDSSGQVVNNFIGPVKILKRGQTRTDGIQINADFPQLENDFCSVGQSLDYYERINTLDNAIKDQVFTALNDAVYNPAIADQFKNEDGWAISVFRDQKDAGVRFMSLARGLITGDYTQVPNESMSFSFAVPGWISPIDFKFDAPKEKDSFWIRSNSSLPERIAVLVGRNGSGKSTLLARLARVAFGTLEERTKPPLSELGILEPSGIGFPRVITIAFSPFDSFRLPGSDSRNKEQVLKEIERGEGRFCFIGLRDLATEGASTSPANNEISNEELFLGDRLVKTHLKSIQQLTEEFVQYIHKIHTQNRHELFQQLVSELFTESPFNSHAQIQSEGSIEDAKSRFLACSTGHKIALLTVTGLLANIQPYSLILVDEPETHLHPPLLAALMHAIRKIFREYEAFAVVATHSPVVVQESLASHVRIVRREGEMTNVLPVTGETFGESIGLISAEVFGLQTDVTDFHKTLDELVARHGELEKIENLFLNGAMSHQARAYVMSRLCTAKSE